jgi:hypothetical protein
MNTMRFPAQQNDSHHLEVFTRPAHGPASDVQRGASLRLGEPMRSPMRGVVDDRNAFA